MTEIVENTEIKITKEKPKRNPTAFALFVKENYNKVKELPNKDRIAKLAQMYKESKGLGASSDGEGDKKQMSNPNNENEKMKQ